MLHPSATGVAAVLCLLVTAAHTACGQACDDGFVLDGDVCRACGDFRELVCLDADGEAFCTGARVVPGPVRCERCGEFGRVPCDDPEEPCDAPDLFPAEDDGGICRPCGGRSRTCCPPESGLSPCRFDFQLCIEGICLNCNEPSPDPGCPNFTGAPPPPPVPMLDPSECADGTTPNSRGSCSPCGEFAQLVCVGDDGSRFCTGDRVIVGPTRCDRCGAFGTPPCDDPEEPCDGPDLFPAQDDDGICRPCGGRLRACCPPETGDPPCRFDFLDCVDGFCLRCDIDTPDPGCPGTVEAMPMGPMEVVPTEEPEEMMGMDAMPPADDPEPAMDEVEAPAEGPGMPSA